MIRVYFKCCPCKSFMSKNIAKRAKIEAICVNKEKEQEFRDLAKKKRKDRHVAQNDNTHTHIYIKLFVIF